MEINNPRMSALDDALAQQQSAVAGFRVGLIRGLCISLVMVIVVLYAGSMLGFLQVTLVSLPSLVDLWYWTYENLRTSLVPFLLVLLWFGVGLVRLRGLLAEPGCTYEEVYRLDKRLDLLVGLFFGIGVIWTAIGMRSALVGALAGLDAESAARLGAFGVLQAMVDEGILLALSTTIVGGIGGYLLRLVKMFSAGSRLDRFYARLNSSAADLVLLRLQAIEQAVRERGATAAQPAGQPPC